MFGRILTILVLVGIALFMLRLALGKKKSPPPPPPEQVPPPASLISCKRCGLHLPSDEAVWHLGQPYCGKDHAGL
ncbi:MAG: PP0621 family protein [Burkholderiaceae bacterium]